MTGDVSGDLTGRRLGNYRIDGVLGKGGMSVTYKATDVRLGRKVALKVIGDHLGADAEFRERFVDEARNTSAIDHANVVPLYDFGELDGMLYIAMRMVDGGDLAGLIAGGAIGPARTLTMLDQVADALDTLHNRGLVHLDVKPANVLVTKKETSREHVYVADFGLTRRGATGHRTRGGDFLGSPTYAAPEHLRGEPLDGRTDQYALTCVLYACLTGSPPFKGDVPTVIKGHLNGDPPAISRVVALPPAIDEVIRRGWRRTRRTVPQLRRDGRGRPPRARPPGGVRHPTGAAGVQFGGNSRAAAPWSGTTGAAPEQRTAGRGGPRAPVRRTAAAGLRPAAGSRQGMPPQGPPPGYGYPQQGPRVPQGRRRGTATRSSRAWPAARLRPARRPDAAAPPCRRAARARSTSRRAAAARSGSSSRSASWCSRAWWWARSSSSAATAAVAAQTTAPNIPVGPGDSQSNPRRRSGCRRRRSPSSRAPEIVPR